MGMKTFAAAAGASLITAFSLPLAYHSRDIHFYPEEVYRVTEEPDGKRMSIINSRMGEIANIRLMTDEKGKLVGDGVVKGHDFNVVVGDQEALFIRKHGAEKMWLGHDVVHVRPDTTAQNDAVPAQPSEPSL